MPVVGGHGLRFQLQSRLCSNSMFAFPEMRRCSLYTILTCHLLVSWCSVSFGLCRQQGTRQRCGRAQRVSHRASSHRVQNPRLLGCSVIALTSFRGFRISARSVQSSCWRREDAFGHAAGVKSSGRRKACLRGRAAQREELLVTPGILKQYNGAVCV